MGMRPQTRIFMVYGQNGELFIVRQCFNVSHKNFYDVNAETINF